MRYFDLRLFASKRWIVAFFLLFTSFNVSFGQNQKFVSIFYFSIYGDGMYKPSNLSPTGDAWIMRGQEPWYSGHGIPNFWGKPWWAANNGDGTIKNNYRFYFNGNPDDTNDALLDWHAELLADAGVDFVILDFTNTAQDWGNGPFYVSATYALCKRWQERREQGLPTPKIAFFVRDEPTLTDCENYFFNVFSPDIFFNYEGKKLLLVADPLGNNDLGSRTQPAVPTNGKFANYTTRHCWAFTGGDYWSFKENTLDPPPPFYHNGQPEQVSAPVAVAGWDRDHLMPDSRGRDNGNLFIKYMDYAKAADAKFVFIFSWNEWNAANWNPDPDNQTHPYFVDQYLTEWSSDIEPMDGGHGWFYYDLMKQKIAEFKGVSLNQSPCPGPAPANIPGIVEAENFDNGGEKTAYHDANTENTGGAYRASEGVDIEPSSEGGHNLAFSVTGEWTEYSVNVTKGGKYRIDTRVASPIGGSFHIEFGGVNVTGTLTVPNTTGWQAWQTVSKEVTLNAGEQIMRFYIDQQEFNTNKFTLTLIDSPPPITDDIVSGAVYKIIGKQSGKAIDVEGVSLDAGAGIHLWSDHGGANQKWKVESADNGFYKLTAQHSNKCLDLPNGSTENGVRPLQWDCWAGDMQLWKLQKDADGFYSVSSKISGKCLDVVNFQTADGSVIAQYPCVETFDNQKWKFVRVGAGASSAPQESTTAVTELTMYPNPAEGSVSVDLSALSDETVSVSIIDIKGKQVYDGKAKGGKNISLNTSKLKPGVYTVILKDKKSVVRKRLVINR